MKIITKTFVTVMLVVWSGSLFAQAPTAYYNNATGKTGDELKVALHNIITGHTTINYSNIWNAFWSTDNKGNNVVWDMYSDGAEYSYSYVSNDQCGEYVQEGDCYNREHSWPQSWFSGNDQAVPSRDLHHVFPTDGFVNAQRGNYPFGEVNTASWTSQNGSKLGTCKSSLGYSGTVFEPIDEYKGDFARALMYMSVRYYGEDDDWGTSGMTNKSEILPWAMTMLLRWNDEDPVSQKEIDRNNAVYGIQGNRNPFIDRPEYARMIWDPNWHGGIGGYEKVTSTDEITDGEYLIVYEGGSLAFDGSLTALDATNNTIEVSIFGNNIESNNITDASAFTITAKTGGYSIKSARGYYIGNTSDANALKTSQTDAYVNTITIMEGDNVDIVSSSSHLRYNSVTDQNRFRYYKSSSYTNQQAIQLYKKITVYSINLADVEHGSISADVEEAIEGTIVTLTATPNVGYEFDHWSVTDTENNTIEVTDNQFEMPSSNVMVSAVFVYVGVFSQQYYLVTDVSQLVAGRTYLIVNTAEGQALSKTQNNNNRSGVVVTVVDGVISSIDATVCELTLGGSTGEWTFYDSCYNNNAGGYLYAAGGGNYLKTKTTLDDKGKWNITISSGVATIVSNGNVTQNNMRYNPNSGNPLFSCYASSSNLAKVELFIHSEEYDHTESETIANLFPFDKHIVRSGAALTVTGTATCNDASHLILEDGAQFVHHSDGVQATVKKTIEAYTEDGGWYTIATPFNAYNPTGVLTTNEYDLYAYDEPADAEWLNYKADAFSLISGHGYLYAHNPTITLRMTGTLNNGDYTNTIDLGFEGSYDDLKGFNLLGNPTVHDISFTKTENISDGYYYLDNNSDWVYSTATTIPAGRGFLVKANASGESITLNPQSKRGIVETVCTPSLPESYLCIAIDDSKAYVKLSEGVSMPLFSLNGHHAPLYLTREGKRYVMLVADQTSSIDLSYEARQAGRHTLELDAEGLGLDYLHLIDHKTGSDIDLLAMPEYTFETYSEDYAARFQLVFSASQDSDSAEESSSFAYVSNGQIIITGFDGDNGAATLQIIDVMGRVLSCRDASHASVIPTLNMSSGIYVLRLITEKETRTQRIVL